MKNVISFFLLAVFASSNPLQARTRRSNISIFSNDYHCLTNNSYPRRAFSDFFSLLGVGYNHALPRHFSVFARYIFTFNKAAFWPNRYIDRYIFSDPAYLPSFYSKAHQKGYYYDPNGVGKLEHRLNYNFFDIGGRYNIQLTPKQSVSLSLGGSYAYGRDSYVTGLTYANKPPKGMGDLINSQRVIRREGYIGGFTGLAYDYFLWKGRINVGVELTARKYEGSFPFFMNYGFHVGYNF